MVGRCRAWHTIIVFRQHKRSNKVGRGMTSPPLDSTHGRTTSAHTVERRRAWHAITALGQHTRSDDIGRGMPSSPLGSTHSQTTLAWHDITALGQHTFLNDVRRGMSSLPWGSTNGQTTSGVERHHRSCTAHTAERRGAWHDITTFGLHARLNDVGHGMTSPH
uniref:Uncharacterized protein n=1 Tax=Solanum lycopersicum TaxID=4081 RepID=A0A494G8G3_SOLLC